MSYAACAAPLSSPIPNTSAVRSVTLDAAPGADKAPPAGGATILCIADGAVTFPGTRARPAVRVTMDVAAAEIPPWALTLANGASDDVVVMPVVSVDEALRDYPAYEDVPLADAAHHIDSVSETGYPGVRFIDMLHVSPQRSLANASSSPPLLLFRDSGTPGVLNRRNSPRNSLYPHFVGDAATGQASGCACSKRVAPVRAVRTSKRRDVRCLHAALFRASWPQRAGSASRSIAVAFCSIAVGATADVRRGQRAHACSQQPPQQCMIPTLERRPLLRGHSNARVSLYGPDPCLKDKAW